MLSTTQEQHLEAIVQHVNDALHIEEATLDAHDTLELVLCRDTVCFRPLRIGQQEVDITAALAGHPAAQQALQVWLQQALQGMLSVRCTVRVVAHEQAKIATTFIANTGGVRTTI